MKISNVPRRQLIKQAAGVALTPLVLGLDASSAESAASPSVRAVGQPFPSGVQLPSSPPKQNTQNSIGIALVGLGRYALAKMAPAIAQSRHCHLAGLVSGNRTKAERVAKAYGLPTDSIYSYADMHKIASDERIQAVYIVLPSGLHAEWTEKSFAAKKHVICEKPMALSESECQRMISASQRAQRKLMIGYRCHFDPNNLEAIDLMRKNIVGKAQLIRTDQHYTMPPSQPANNWRVNRALAGGGALEDYGIYGLQAALYLTGEMPTHVSASISTPINNPTFSEIFNLVTSRLTFPSGIIAQLASSYNAVWNDRVEIRGDSGIMLMDPATAYQGHKISISQSSNNRTLKSHDPTIQFIAMMDHFGETIKNNGNIKTDGAMGLRDIRLIEAIYASAKKGTEIALNPDGTIKG